MRLLFSVAGLLAIGIIAACGSSNSPTSSLSGKVADGYLVGATVFLDMNGNYQLDPGEPFATTDQNGGYSLMVARTDVGKYPIVALATKGETIDLDTGTAVQSSYVLSMPAFATSGMVNSNFISPMSSQLRELMETGTYDSMQQAMSELRVKLGMPVGTDLMADYMAANNTAMHTAARNMASLMGSQMSQVLGTTGPKTTVDVNRYRGMMGAIFSDISSVKGPNAQPGMSSLMNTMMTNLPGIAPDRPFRNMSAAFRGRMMSQSGTSVMGGGMMR